MSMFHGKRNQAQHLRGVVLHERIAVAVLRQVVTTCKCRGSLGTLWHSGSLNDHVEFNDHLLMNRFLSLRTPAALRWDSVRTCFSNHASPKREIKSSHSTLHTLHALHTSHSAHTLHSPHSTLHTLDQRSVHSAVYTPPFTLDAPHSSAPPHSPVQSTMVCVQGRMHMWCAFGSVGWIRVLHLHLLHPTGWKPFLVSDSTLLSHLGVPCGGSDTTTGMNYYMICYLVWSLQHNA